MQRKFRLLSQIPAGGERGTTRNSPVTLALNETRFMSRFEISDLQTWVPAGVTEVSRNRRISC
jgi:hypothetical protein